MQTVDALELARALISRPSVTPREEGTLDLVQAALEPLGFSCRRMPFGEVDNLYARRGSAGPNLCFLGHVDVVPPGDPAAWRHPPFAAVVEDGWLYGRGSADMKGSVAVWAAAVAAVLARGEPAGSLSVLLTSDEEGIALDGTKRVIAQLQAEGERIDGCVVGEPSSVARLGDTMKVGRRGSLSATIVAEGIQGHVAYPERAANPVPVLIDLLAALQHERLDDGWPLFPPTNLEVTTVDVGNPAGNVIPAKATAKLNIRFNPARSGDERVAWLRERCEAAGRDGVRVTCDALHSGDAFLTEQGPLTAVMTEAVETLLGLTPQASTGGGTSDARFMRTMAPVVELGPVGATIHHVDERVAVADLHALQGVYERVIERFFSS